MHLRHLRIQNLKLIRSLELSFLNEDGSPRKWTVLVGENGLCKTALLQAIALVAAGHDRGNQLLASSKQRVSAKSLLDRRIDDAVMTINAEFGFSTERHSVRKYPGLDARPEIPPFLNSTVEVRPRTEILRARSHYTDPAQSIPGKPFSSPAHPMTSNSAALDFPGPIQPLAEVRGNLVRENDGPERPISDWFVAGYGVGRALFPPMVSTLDFDANLDRFRPLFDINHQILGLRFADMLPSPSEYKGTLREVLVGNSDNGRLLPRIEKIDLRGKGYDGISEDLLYAQRFDWSSGNATARLPAIWLSQGYQGTIAWIADLLGHAFWEAQGIVDISKLEGLVLIDELDLHLHPRWQVDLVPRLKTIFPGMQFVVTTHSPMLLPGFKKEEIFRLCMDDDGNVVTEPSLRSPSLMTGSEIYSQFFGIDDLYPQELGRDLRRYGRLAADPTRSDAEEVEVQTLRDKLRRAGIEISFEPEPRTRPA